MDEILLAHPEQEATPNDAPPTDDIFQPYPEQATTPDSTLTGDGIFLSYAEPQEPAAPEASTELDFTLQTIDFASTIEATDKPPTADKDATKTPHSQATTESMVTESAAGVGVTADNTVDTAHTAGAITDTITEIIPESPAVTASADIAAEPTHTTTHTTTRITTRITTHTTTPAPSIENPESAPPAPRQGIHPRLQTQLAKCGLDARTLPANLGQWRKFLAITNRLYQSSDESQQRLERSLAESTQEMYNLHGNLKQETDQRIAFIHRSEQKNRFMANMSHELRTPIHGILGSLEVLRDTGLSDRQRNFVETAHSSCELMQELVDNILDFSKIRSGHMTLDVVEFSPRELLEKISQNLAPQAHGRDIQVHCFIPEDIPERVCGDVQRIRQILSSLIANAIKFTEQGEVVTRIDIAEVSDDTITLHFEVHDTGIGIPEDMHEAIFEPYIQVDNSSSRRFAGTGLGLAIAKELAGLMNSKIQLDSEPGKGSRFWFDLSLPVMEPYNGATENSSLNGRYILVVDHNETSQTILKSHLKAWKAKPISANSGMEALQMLLNSITLNEPFAAVLIDWAMPEMDGSTLARAIRSDRHYDNLPLIMLANYQLESTSQLQNGINGSITKPLRAKVLKELLIQHLQNPPTRKSEQPTLQQTLQQTPIVPAILLAEDNPVNALIATTMLEDLDFRVDHVENGQEAFRAVCNYPYKLVLMDINMPEMDGHKATQAIREWEKGHGRPPVPVLAMTANALKGDRDKCLAAGMNDYIAKPIHKEDLLKLIQRWLEKSSLPAEESKEDKAEPEQALPA